VTTFGVFDSGIGGLTVVKEIKKKNPGCSVVYLGDTARVPYGPRGREVILRFSQECIKFLQKFEIDALVIACNTVSALAAEEIKKDLQIPVYEMLHPAVSAAKKRTKNNKIAVIGTHATISSHAYRRLLTGCNVFEQVCPLFVPCIEEGEVSGEIIELLAKKYLSFVKDEECDTLILGCTHYPIIKDVIKKIVGEHVELIHCGEALAEVLEGDHDEKEDVYFLTDVMPKSENLAQSILEQKITFKKAIL